MDPTREAEELVRLWQELQLAQVAGDAQRLASLRIHAESRARRPGASPEWQALAREAGRYTAQIHEQVEAQPTAGVGAEAMPQYEAAPPAHYEVDEVSAPDAAMEPAEEAGTRGRGRGLGPIVWLVIIVGYLVLQVIGGLTGGEGP
ncbi:MAG TPA: hypothetical protein VM204_01580 [Gaiellaceae bacterium]|nr:hypothetical protein [Gaiellaceae bacterium]